MTGSRGQVTEAMGISPLHFIEVTGAPLGVMVSFGMCSRDMTKP